jgi:putative transposase
MYLSAATLIAVEIVRKNPDQIGFAVNPRRWVVERFLAYRAQSTAGKGLRGHHRLPSAFLYVASVMLLVRRIARAL